MEETAVSILEQQETGIMEEILISFEEERSNGQTSIEENEISILEPQETEIMSKIFAKLPGEPEVLLEVLTRLPPNAVFKFKCVSKSLSSLTKQPVFTIKHTRNCKAIARPLTGFFFQGKLLPYCLFKYKWLEYNDMDIGFPEFVSIQEDAGRLPDPSLGFLKPKGEETWVELIDSCNGLLLCNTITVISTIKSCFVCNPLTKEYIVLPHPRRRSNRLYYALIANLTQSGNLQYKVICVYRPKFGDPNPCSRLLILSSETGEWEELDESLPALCHESMMGSKVVFNGKLFWDCLEGHILICHLNVKKSQRCYELLEAPKAPLGRCLWIFKDKLICYCHGFADEFPSWSLWIDEKNKSKWKLDGCKEFETLTEDICSQYTENWLHLKKVKPRIRFKIMAYRPESNSIMLWIPDSIYSYELSERRLEYMWGYRAEKFNSPTVALPYVHSLAPIQIGKSTEEECEMTEINEEDLEGKNNNDPNAMDDCMELMLSYENWANFVKPRRK